MNQENTQPSGLIGLHSNLHATLPADLGPALAVGTAPTGQSEKERAEVDSINTFSKDARAYAFMMTTRPGITVFLDEIYRTPKTWARRAYPNLFDFHEVDKGGHFAEWEQPELFAEEIPAAFRSFR